MIITLGNISKKFGDISYIFVTYIINISNFIVEMLLESLSLEYFEKSFLVIIIFNDIITMVCVYLLIGSRIIFIKIYSGEKTIVNLYPTPKNITDFVPLKKNKKNRFIMQEASTCNNGNFDNENISFSNYTQTNNI